MIIARFEFKAKYAAQFIEDAQKGQTVIELEFESVEALIEACKTFEDVIVNCTASVDGQLIDLRQVSGL